MTTAEKRAQLQAESEPWPDCECHDEPCYWQKDVRLGGGGRFVCAVQSRRSHQQGRRKRLDAGGCIHCGDELATEIRCARHADEHADYMAGPFQQLQNRAATTRYRRRLDEDFQPLGVGLAAFAAYMKQPGS